MITDRLRLYGVARCNLGLKLEHRKHESLNNWADNVNQPRRRRERIMKRFQSERQARRFLSIHDQIANLFYLPHPEYQTVENRRVHRA
jgi:putative transposase